MGVTPMTVFNAILGQDSQGLGNGPKGGLNMIIDGLIMFCLYLVFLRIEKERAEGEKCNGVQVYRS